MVTREHHVALVDHLVESTEPVRRIWPVRARMGAFFVGWSAATVAIAYRWPRPDLVAKLHDPVFATGLAALAIAAFVPTVRALRCAVPGRAPTRVEGLVALALIAVAAALLGLEPSAGRVTVEGWLCSLRTIVVGALPWTILLIAVRRGAPVHVLSAAVYAAAASLLCATTVLRLACPADGSNHWLVWHLGIVPLGTLLATPFATHWLASWRRA
jgi:hypothetical protein